MDILLTEDQLAAGIDRLAAEVGGATAGRPLLVVGVLTGSVVLVADLIRRLQGPVQVAMVWASSYRGPTTTPGPLEVRLESLPNVNGRHLLVVDDIFDTGHTLMGILGAVRRLGAASVHSLVLLEKEGRAEVPMRPDFVGFRIPDRFVVGYGLDFDGAWRHLPYLAALDEGEIQGLPVSPSSRHAGERA
jgi:hypoxanthine phosphoribosyltransferase